MGPPVFLGIEVGIDDCPVVDSWLGVVSVFNGVMSLLGSCVGSPIFIGNDVGMDDSVVKPDVDNVETFTDLSLSKLLAVNCPPPDPGTF